MKIVIASWKMNPGSADEAEVLAKAMDIEGYIMCPPFVCLEDVSKTISKAMLGAQDVFFEGPTGARTGNFRGTTQGSRCSVCDHWPLRMTVNGDPNFEFENYMAKDSDLIEIFFERQK